MDIPSIHSYTCEATAVFILRLSTETFAVYNRHEVLRCSWAVALKPARSRTTPLVRGVLSPFTRTRRLPSRPPIADARLGEDVGSDLTPKLVTLASRAQPKSQRTLWAFCPSGNCVD